ncbi:unnamed protein product [Prorocentrum cordatum]|uniref:ATP-dependent DNA helicase n=1 Tax=Prorocentrum cordatum TaxID=2364126 RepID=A0ABN9SVT2_9DINO|nr:unnamed protein product [Polarella glacialis]
MQAQCAAGERQRKLLGSAVDACSRAIASVSDLLRSQLAKFFEADPDIFDLASRRIPFDHQKEIVEGYFEEALARGRARADFGADEVADGSWEIHKGDVRNRYHSERGSRTIHLVEKVEGAKCTEEEFAEFYQLYDAKTDDGEPMLDRGGIMRCIGKRKTRYGEFAAKVQDMGAATRAPGPRPQKLKVATQEFLEEQTDEPQSVTQDDARRAEFAARAAPRTGRFTFKPGADGAVERALAEEQKALAREMLSERASTMEYLFSQGNDLQKTSGLVLEEEAADRAGEPSVQYEKSWLRWAKELSLDSPSVVCFACGVKVSKHHCMRECLSDLIAQTLREGASEITPHICDYCVRAEDRGARVSRGAIDTGNAPEPLRGPIRHEERVLQLAETNVVMVHAPKGGTATAKGGAFVAPLEAPRACEVLGGASMEITDGVLWLRPRGAPPGWAVPARAQKLLDALKWLARSNAYYRDIFVLGQATADIEALATKLAEKLADDRPAIDPEAEAAAQGAFEGDATYSTAGGPAKVGAVVGDLQKNRESAEIRPLTEALAFPTLFPGGEGSCPEELCFSSYAWRRLLDCKTKFQDNPDYTFCQLETWFRKSLRSATSVFAGKREVPGREAAERRAYAVQGKVPGTTAFLGQKRTRCVQVMRQLGRPDFFLALTSHKRQPHMLAACVKAQLYNDSPGLPLDRVEKTVAAQVLAYTNDPERKWDGSPQCDEKIKGTNDGAAACESERLGDQAADGGEAPAGAEDIGYMDLLQGDVKRDCWGGNLDEVAQPRPDAAPPVAGDSIWRVSIEQLDQLLSGKASAVVRPRGLKDAGRKWLACTADAGAQIVAVARVAGARQVMSQDEWRQKSKEHGMSRRTCFYRKTFLVHVRMVQQLAEAVPCADPGARACGDHVFRPTDAGPPTDRVLLLPPPRRYFPDCVKVNCIWDIDAAQMDVLASGSSTVVARPVGVVGEERKWLARAADSGAQIAGWTSASVSREAPSEEEWAAARETSGLVEDALPFAPTFLVELRALQLFAKPVDYAPPRAGSAVGGAPPPPQPHPEPRVGGEAAERGGEEAEGEPPAAPKRPAADWLDGAASETDDELLGPSKADNVACIYDVYARTTGPKRWRGVYRDGVMTLLTKSLMHKHGPYFMHSLGRCRFGFPQQPAEKSRKKSQRELWNNGSKNEYFVRRRSGATMMGLYNPRILRRWRGSMDLQVAGSSHAVARYILGYCLKNDTAKDAAGKLNQDIARVPATGPVTSKQVNRLAYIGAQGRVTSTFEACHHLLGLPVVRISREFQWVHAGMPESYSAYVPRHLWRQTIANPEDAPEPTAPAVIRRYAEWRAGKVAVFDDTGEQFPLLVEGGAAKNYEWVSPREVTLFDFVASYSTSYISDPKLRAQPAIASTKAFDPERETETYYYSKLLLHYPWADFDEDDGPEWLGPSDDGSHQSAFVRLSKASNQGEHGDEAEAPPEDAQAREEEAELPAPDFFLKSTVFPNLGIAEAAWRGLKRLSCALVMRSAMQTPGAAEDWENRRELLRRLRLAAGRPDEEADDPDQGEDLEELAGAAPHAISAFGPVARGDEAVQLLFGPDAQKSKQQDIVYWFLEQVRQGNRAPARVLLHGPGGCGKSVVVRAVARLLRTEGHGVALAAPTGCAAFLINGCTLHSCFHLPVENKSFATPRSTSANRECHSAAFLLLCGDLYQLPPPKGQPVYAAVQLWKMSLVCELEGNHRAAWDPACAALLERVRKGLHTEADLATLRTRLRKPPADSRAPHLLATRKAVRQVNEEMLERHAETHGFEVRAAPAQDTSHRTGPPVEVDTGYDNPEDTGGLESDARFAIGAEVVLRRNLDISDGRVNGARGMVTDIKLARDSGEVLKVRAEFERGGQAAREEESDADLPGALISPVQGAFQNEDGERILRRQPPLVLCWGLTIHKAQGGTETKGIALSLDETVRQQCQAYVGLSRVECLADLYLAAFDERAIAPAVGVDHALLQLRLQQGYEVERANGPNKNWRACFAPAQTAQELEDAIASAPPGAFAERQAELLEARAAEERGDKGAFTREHFGEECGTKRALATRKRETCTVARMIRVRKRPAGGRWADAPGCRPANLYGDGCWGASAAPAAPAVPPRRRARLAALQQAPAGAAEIEAEWRTSAAPDAETPPSPPPPPKRPRLTSLAPAASGAEAAAAPRSAPAAAAPPRAPPALKRPRLADLAQAAGSGADGGARANAPAAASGRLASRSVASQAMGSATGAATGSGRAASSGPGGALGRRRPCGFRSVGNSCYMNSLLQALFPLAPAQRMIAATLGALGDEPEEGLFDLLRQGNKLVGTAIAAWRARGALEPELFLDWHNGEQEDAQEFLQLNLLQNDGPELADLCRGIDWPRLSRPACPASRDATGAEPFTILSLPLVAADGRRAFASVRTALADYIEAPYLVEVDDWQCPCAGFVAHRASVLKTHRITCVQEILLLHLVRWDSFGRAVPHPVAADAVLEVRGPDSVGIFSLKAVVVHRGATTRKGHYCAFAKYDGTWWLYDDDASRVATEAEIAFFGSGQGAAALTKVHLACYERLDSAAPLPAQGRLVVEASDAAL